MAALTTVELECPTCHARTSADAGTFAVGQLAGNTRVRMYAKAPVFCIGTEDEPHAPAELARVPVEAPA